MFTSIGMPYRVNTLEKPKSGALIGYHYVNRVNPDKVEVLSPLRTIFAEIVRELGELSILGSLKFTFFRRTSV